MMTRLLFVFLVLAVLPAEAADRITATVTITNTAGTVNGDTFVLNGSTRTWTNTVVTPASQILTNNSIGGVTTNLWNHVNATPFSQVVAVWVATNQLQFIGGIGTAMTVSFGGNWATNSYSTQTVSAVDTVRVPMSALPVVARTNDATRLITGLNDYAQNSLSQTGTVSAELLGTTNTQTISAKKTWTGSNVFALITTTNLVNYGNAISSPGSGTTSEQFGTGALATNTSALAVGNTALAKGVRSIAVGNSALATNESTTAVGYQSTANREFGTAVGANSSANATNAVALGNFAAAVGTDAIAIGFEADASFDNSIALGSGVTSTTTNQIRLGTTAHTVSVPGILVAAAVSNSTYYGTVGLLSSGYLSGVGSTNSANTNSTFKGVFYPRSSVTSLATNGVNVALDFGIFSYIKLSALTGGDGAFSIGGIANGADGRWLQIENDTGQNLTIVHESAGEGTVANRIHTMTGADVSTTANGFLEVIYDSADSRWKLKYLTP